MQSSSYHILGTDRRRFEMVGIRGVSNYPSYHRIFQDRLFFIPTEAGHKCDAVGISEQVVKVNGGRKYNER